MNAHAQRFHSTTLSNATNATKNTKNTKTPVTPKATRPTIKCNEYTILSVPEMIAQYKAEAAEVERITKELEEVEEALEFYIECAEETCSNEYEVLVIFIFFCH